MMSTSRRTITRAGHRHVDEVDDVVRFVSEHPQVSWVGESIDVPGGRYSASLTDPAGNTIHIFDQIVSSTTDANQNARSSCRRADTRTVRAPVPA